MKDRSSTQLPKLSADLELLQTIYETALIPDNYDDLIDTWSTRLEQALDQVADLEGNEPEDAITLDLSDSIRYLDTSLRLFERLDTARRLEAQNLGGDRTTLPKIVLDSLGKVVWYNSAALRLFGLSRQSSAQSLSMDAGSRRRLDAELHSLGNDAGAPGQGARALPLVVMLQQAEDGAPVFMIGKRLAQTDQADLLVLDQADTGWNDAVEAVLQGSFALSRTETDIVARLAEGQTLAQIAKDRNRQVSTLRTQLKSALRKTQTRSQAQLVRLTLSLASHLDAATAGMVESSAPFHTLALRDGRILQYRAIGPPDGAPVMFLHGMLDGLGFGTELLAGLHARHLRLIAPERPWFGSAPGYVCDVPSAPDVLADDLVHLLEAFDLRDVRLIGHMAGSVYSFTLAAKAKDRVRGIVNVAGGVPITSLGQFRHMSPRQRTVAYTARFTPSALPLILHAGVRQIESGGVDRFVRALYAKSPLDLAAYDNPQIGSLIADGVRFAVAQGYKAFEIDSYHVVRDWSYRAQLSRCPVNLVHGRHDPVVSAASVETFGGDLGARAQVRIAEDAGQTILFTHPRLVLDALDAL